VIAAKISAATRYLTEEYASGWNPWSRMYFDTVKLSAQSVTVASSMKSAAERRIGRP
jgi:hypothetical protein